MFANLITLTRQVLTFIVIALFGGPPNLDFVLIAGIAGIFALDAVDGYIARKRNETSKLGEVFDTLADRVIENTFWIYFTAIGMIPLWSWHAVLSQTPCNTHTNTRKTDGHTPSHVHVLAVDFTDP